MTVYCRTLYPVHWSAYLRDFSDSLNKNYRNFCKTLHTEICFISLGDGKCVICDSYVRPCTLVRICDECNYGSYQGRCVTCGGPGVSDAYYCKECTVQEKDVSILFMFETSY